MNVILEGQHKEVRQWCVWGPGGGWFQTCCDTLLTRTLLCYLLGWSNLRFLTRRLLVAPVNADWFLFKILQKKALNIIYCISFWGK